MMMKRLFLRFREEKVWAAVGRRRVIVVVRGFGPNPDDLGKNSANTMSYDDFNQALFLYSLTLPRLLACFI